MVESESGLPLEDAAVSFSVNDERIMRISPISDEGRFQFDAGPFLRRGENVIEVVAWECGGPICATLDEDDYEELRHFVVYFEPSPGEEFIRLVFPGSPETADLDYHTTHVWTRVHATEGLWGEEVELTIPDPPDGVLGFWDAVGVAATGLVDWGVLRLDVDNLSPGEHTFDVLARSESGHEDIAPLTLVVPGVAVSALRTSQAASVPASGAVSLRPGWNLVGWTGAPMTPAEATAPIREAIDGVFTWDQDAQAFLAYREGAPAFLNTLAEVPTGTGLWLFATKEVTWEQPLLAGARDVPLVSGFNLVMWTGSTAIEEAMGGLGDVLVTAFTYDAAAQRFRSYRPGAASFLNTATTLAYGDGVWLQVSEPVVWSQPRCRSRLRCSRAR